jgi:hypothetical protein
MLSHAIGVLDATAQTDLNETVAGLEDLHIQAVQNLSILLDQGVDVVGYKNELDSLAQQISLLKSDTITLPGDAPSLSAWRQRADTLNAKLHDVLNRTSKDRQHAGELVQLRGFGWAVGVGLAATAIGAWVWTHRRKGRRRR